MRVFKRGYSIDKPELVHVAGDGKYPSVVQAIVAEREKNRQELLREPDLYLERIEKLEQRLEKNGNTSQKERLDELKKIYMSELERKKTFQR